MKKLTSLVALCALVLNLASQAYGLGLTDPWWLQGGNFTGSTQNLGTSDNFDLPIITNNVEVARFTTGGGFQVGSATAFNVASNGDITRLHGVATSFPSANATGVLHNNGAGTYSIVADGGAPGGGLPSGTANQTLRNVAGTSWAASSVLTNDGTDLVDSGKLTVQGSTITGGTAGTSFTATFGQGTTGTDTATVTARSGNSGTTAPSFTLNRNGTDFSQWTYNGTNTFVDYTGVLTFRSGIAGATKVTFSAGGNVTAVGSTHTFGTAGSALLLTAGIADTGATNSIISVGSGDTGTAEITFGSSSGVHAQFGTDQTNTFLDYTGNLNFRSPVAGATRATLSTGGNFDATGSTHFFGTAGTATTLTVGQGTTGTDAATITARSGNSGSTTPAVTLNRNGTDIAQWAYNGTSTFFDWTGTLVFRGGVGGTQRSAWANDGSAFSFGTAGTAITFTIGQGTTGSDASTLRIRSGNTTTTAPSIFLDRNNSDIAQWTFNGTDTFFDYTGILKLRSGTGGSNVFSIDSTGDIVLLHGITTSFPSVNSAGVLHNNGSGVYSIVADGGAPGGGLPSGTANQTLRNSGGTTWVASSVLLNDATNLTDSGTLTVQGNAITGGTSATAFTATFGQGGVGATAGSVIVNAGSTGTAGITLQQNGTTRLLLDNAGALATGRIGFPLLLGFFETVGSTTIGSLQISGTLGATFTAGQGTTGTDVGSIIARSGNSGSTTAFMALNRNGTNIAQWITDGTNTFDDYVGSLNFRSGIAGTTRATLTSGGNFDAVGSTHFFGTAGTATTVTVGQGAAGAEAATLRVQSGASNAPAVVLTKGPTDFAQFLVSGPDTMLDYAGILNFRSGIGGTAEATLDSAGSFTATGPTHVFGMNGVSTTLTVGIGGVNSTNASVTVNAGSTGSPRLIGKANGSENFYLDSGGGFGTTRFGFNAILSFSDTSISSAVISQFIRNGSLGATLTVGQGLTGTDIGKVVARSGNSGSTAATMALNRNTVDVAQWTYNGTATNFDFTTGFNLRAGIAGTTIFQATTLGTFLMSSLDTNNSAILEIVGTQPPSVAGNGNPASIVQADLAIAGGNTSGTTGQTAGKGSVYIFQTGDGGTAPSGSTNGDGGTFDIPLGSAGAGAGAAGTGGKFRIQNSVTTDEFTVTNTGNMSAFGATHIFGTAGTATTVTVGQSTTGSDASTLRVRSGDSGTTAPTVVLRRNATDRSQWTFNGTDTFFDYTGIMNFRAGIAGTSEVQFSATGGITAIGGTHAFGTAGTAITFTIGQGTTGSDASTLRVQSGDSTTTAPTVVLRRNATDRSQWTFNGTNTFFDYTGTQTFRTGIAGTTTASLTAGGDLSVFQATAGTEIFHLETTATTSNPIYSCTQTRVTTTNTGTATYDVASASNLGYSVEVWAVARCISGAGCTAGTAEEYFSRSSFHNTSGTLTRGGGETTVLSGDLTGAAAGNVATSASGTNIRTTVTGTAATTTQTWSLKVCTQSIGG